MRSCWQLMAASLSALHTFHRETRCSGCTHDPCEQTVKSTITRVMTKFNSLPRHTWVPFDKDRIFPLTVPTSPQCTADRNWTGRVNIPGETEEDSTLKTLCICGFSFVAALQAQREERGTAYRAPCQFLQPWMKQRRQYHETMYCLSEGSLIRSWP